MTSILVGRRLHFDTTGTIKKPSVKSVGQWIKDNATDGSGDLKSGVHLKELGL
jgi:hypothetical protein